MTITFVRHTSVAVPAGICYGQSDVAVAPSFIEEARQVVNNLPSGKFDAVFSSPLSRCRQLAAFCGYPSPLLDDRLKELNFGRWEMQEWENINDPLLAVWYEDWIHTPAGGGESFEEQCKRVASFIRELQTQPSNNIGIFTHRGVIACAMIHAGLCNAEDSFNADIPYGSVHTLTF